VIWGDDLEVTLASLSLTVLIENSRLESLDLMNQAVEPHHQHIDDPVGTDHRCWYLNFRPGASSSAASTVVQYE